jgi:hypothetical protein
MVSFDSESGAERLAAWSARAKSTNPTQSNPDSRAGATMITAKIVWNDSFICETRDEFIVPLQLRVSARHPWQMLGKRAALKGTRARPSFQFGSGRQHK